MVSNASVFSQNRPNVSGRPPREIVRITIWSNAVSIAESLDDVSGGRVDNADLATVIRISDSPVQDGADS
jgi:hypothetical protein